ncbi:hypothetical protein F2P45_31075 [Massilia sp. CCM 8733]|uniref:Uncharacterized protein n=1 Tax=Massilia mucilaginosa TaxID=2609282 RepID=A0ABX0P311_9BURK|nr:hypothetical protein [Massilia mucilaginosa]NHZ93418.1 hypothetical protein [Massilia mucilaginosa]
MISKENWEEFFLGYHIYKCAVASKNHFYFVLLELVEGNDISPRKRLVSIIVEDDDEVISCAEYDSEYFDLARLASVQKPTQQAVMVALDGDVAVMGSGFNGFEDSIPLGKPGLPLETSAHAVASIDGYAYVVGAWRSVCRRSALGQWETLADRSSLPKPEKNKFGRSNQGFKVIAGFSSSDIYAGGGEGDLWHYNGEKWNRCAVPTNMYIETICCGGDGLVYVGLQSGSIMQGRNNKWKLVHKGDMTLPFQDMVWFQDKVWCTSDYGIWTIENGKLTDPLLPAEVRSCSGNLSVNDGVMLLAGMYGATVFDGIKWMPLCSELT